MMRFGIEGKHYIINDEGKMQFEGSERNGGDRPTTVTTTGTLLLSGI